MRTVKKPKGKIRAGNHQPKTLRAFEVGDSPINLTTWQAELEDYKDVLLGRVEPPIAATSRLSLMEVSDMYYARASEMTMEIQRLEREGRVDKANPAYRFRTGELRTFIEMCKNASALGSRRLAAAQLEFEQSKTGRESAW